MGKMNLLKANWEGKVGQTVGAKWKNKSTIRTYTKPSNPNTAGQQSVRGVFAEMTAQIMGGTFDKTTLLISKGGLQKVAGESANETSGKITVTWTKPTATNFTANAELIAVMVQPASGLVEVVSAPAAAETVSGSMTFAQGNVDVYVYYLDKRGSNKVASASDYISVNIA